MEIKRKEEKERKIESRDMEIKRKGEKERKIERK
jgi:hypothetical protein